MENKQNNKPWNIQPNTRSRQTKKKSVSASKSPVIIAVIAAICIIIYLTAIVQAAIRLYLCVENSRTVAEEEFSKIAEIAYHAGESGFVNYKFEETMKRALDSCARLEALIIVGLDRDCAVEKQKDYAVSWANNTPRFINRFSFSNHEYNIPLPIKSLYGVNIRAVASVFDNNDIIKILKQTLLIITAGFIISFFTMLFRLLFGKKETSTAAPRSSNSVIYAPPPDSEDDDFDAETPEAPKGLYSPRTGLGWEEYIKDRLDSELHRCSSSEQDLTLVCIEFLDLTNNKMLKQSAEEAVAFFSSRDLVFEYGRWGIAAILPGVSLEASIAKAEKFYKHIMEKFPRGYSDSSGLCIGLTSRSGRLLNAGRLMLEAGEALKKAKTDPKSPIIAFKSDPEKYREFISRKGP